MSSSSSSSGCGCCMLKCCWKLFTLVFMIGLSVLIYWAIFQPHQIRATVGSATLAGLAVANASATVSYRLALTLDLYNPSLRVGIYYDALDAQLTYRGASLGGVSSASPAEFYQRRKGWETVKVEFAGTGVVLGRDAARELEKEMGAGAVSLQVAVDARVRYRFNTIKIRQKPDLWCSLVIPVKPDQQGGGVGGALTSGDRCSVKY